MDIYVIATPLLLHTVKCLRIGLRLVWHWAQVLYKWEWWGPGTLGPLMTSPPSLWQQGEDMEILSPPVGSELCLGPPPLLFRSHSLCAWGSPHWELEAKKEGLPHLEISVCLVPDFFHFRICFQLLCNYRYKKKKISNATERYKIRHPTLWNLQLIIVNQVVST